MEFAVIGAGVSGMACARMLSARHRVTVFEREETPGGLIRCRRVQGSLFHQCGGHVFNSKREDVLEWFWGQMRREEEFLHATRNSAIVMPDGSHVAYPIETHLYQLPRDTQRQVLDDLLAQGKEDAGCPPAHFEAFLRHRFGDTLYALYFKPYNEKIWRHALSGIPLDWLEGKLPMPTREQILLDNINHADEKAFVHSAFWYPISNGSQFVADRLAQGLDIRFGQDIRCIRRVSGGWEILGTRFDAVVFCGDVRALPALLQDPDWDAKDCAGKLSALPFHGTTAVFCEVDPNPYSWIYLPDPRYKAHRIICSGNFAPSNNASSRSTATIEFTDSVTLDEIKDNLARIPLHPKYLDHQCNLLTYPVQEPGTRELIARVKASLSPRNFYMTGRFVDWEYYNIDAAIGAAMDTCAKIGLQEV